ncbi:MAG: hypothetical protein DWH91_16385 [Planctomycetota bacterium]|nr:MAG: hypothetical protein DWH91_16385 [Planctomycetota bacterium]
MFGLFGGKDWNVLAVIFERVDLFQVSAQRVKGAAADKARDGAQAHPRTILWAVFDQKGKYLQGGQGSGATAVSSEIVKKLERDLGTNSTILGILKLLETKQTDKLAKPLVWIGYPRKAALPPKDAPED